MYRNLFFAYSTGFVGLSFDNFDNLATLILSAMRTGSMRADLLVAVRTLGELRDAQSIVRPAGGRAALGMASFWIRHDSLLLPQKG